MGRVLVLVLGLAFVGCGDSDSGTDTGSGSDAGGTDSAATDTVATDSEGTDATSMDSGGFDVPPPGDNALVIGPITAPSREERTVCITRRLGNDAPLLVSGVHARLSPGSHHMIVYRSTETEEAPTPTPCLPFVSAGSADQAPLVIAEKPDTSVVYPEGAALRLDANQMIRLEIHYINYTSDEPIEITGMVWFDEYEGDPGSVAEVRILFEGPTALSVPARMESQAEYFASVPGSDERPLRVFAVTTHTHQWGVLSTIHRADSASDPGELIHESRNWAEPPLDTFDPPLEFTGTDGLRLTCNYNNTSSSNIGFGLGFEQEMCFLWAYTFRP